MDIYFGRSVKPWVAGDALDLGCSTGGRAVAWWERYRPTSLSGVDVDEVLITSARQFAESRAAPITFKVGSGEEIPWPDSSFDAILTFDVLEHVRSVEQTLAECWRVLRAGRPPAGRVPELLPPLEHHLSLVSRTPGLQYLFTGKTLIQAYREILDERGSAAGWYGRSGELRGLGAREHDQRHDLQALHATRP